MIALIVASAHANSRYDVVMICGNGVQRTFQADCCSVSDAQMGCRSSACRGTYRTSTTGILDFNGGFSGRRAYHADFISGDEISIIFYSSTSPGWKTRSSLSCGINGGGYASATVLRITDDSCNCPVGLRASSASGGSGVGNASLPG
jgi:hypothetical protein